MHRPSIFSCEATSIYTRSDASKGRCINEYVLFHRPCTAVRIREHSCYERLFGIWIPRAVAHRERPWFGTLRHIIETPTKDMPLRVSKNKQQTILTQNTNICIGACGVLRLSFQVLSSAMLVALAVEEVHELVLFCTTNKPERSTGAYLTINNS